MLPPIMDKEDPKNAVVIAEYAQRENVLSKNEMKL